MSAWGSLTEAARAILGTADCRTKAAMTETAASLWRAGSIAAGAASACPDRPARPERPVLRPPREMKRRRSAGGIGGRIALLHAVAHIEVNALDLVWDLIARFQPPGPCYLDDWVTVALEEANHFRLLDDRLSALDVAYGDLPAHDGLWQMAARTSHDLAARLALVPLVMEARGLDVTPAMIGRLEAAGDLPSAAILRVIYVEEIGHVAAGRHWFERVCAGSGRAPEPTWRTLVEEHFRGPLKPPFNHAAREAAGLERGWYEAAGVGH